MGKTLTMNEEELEKAIASAKKSLDNRTSPMTDSTRPINYAPPNEEPNEETEEERPTKRCGDCMSDGIHPDARRCPHCGVKFAWAAQEEHDDQMSFMGCLLIIGIAFLFFLVKCAPDRKEANLRPKLEINNSSLTVNAQLKNEAYAMPTLL